jgi:hypothetical protein
MITLKVQKYIQPSELQELPIFERDFNEEEFNSSKVYLNSWRRINWLESLFIPTRTDTLGNFCQDFFFPGLFNEALKSQDVSQKILGSFVMVAFDVITFPLRLITVIPRTLYNVIYSKENHSFYKYLINNSVVPEDLIEGCVYLKIKEHQDQGIIRETGTTFNFIPLPKYVTEDSNCFVFTNR